MRRVLERLRPIVIPLLVGSLGAWLALLLAGPVRYPVGPFDVELFARPGAPVTEIHLPPFGRIRADTHRAPLHLSATLTEFAAPELTSSLRSGGTHGIVRQVERDGAIAVRRHARASAAVALAGAATAGVVAFRRRWRPVAGSLLAGGVIFLLTAGTTVATYRSSAFLEPTFTGSLTLAPRLLGPVRGATDRIEDFRAELTRIVDGAVRAYGVIAAQPPSTSRVVALHISDVHASPVGMDVAQRLAEAFEVDLVLDSGDITTFNTPLEQEILARIPDFGIPYVFVRGNHDSPATTAQIAAYPNVHVLEDETVEVLGLRVHGLPDPELTPANPDRAGERERIRLLRERGEVAAERFRAAGEPPDVLLVHDERMAEPLAGVVPLVLGGHFHRTEARVLEGTPFLRVGT
ncbi:MAG TPA: metallophosphoesterase, partial [Actinomycetota bacterium]|nr:metallophosphoesterase [Actinomycetota bacterium]